MRLSHEHGGRGQVLDYSKPFPRFWENVPKTFNVVKQSMCDKFTKKVDGKKPLARIVI